MKLMYLYALFLVPATIAFFYKAGQMKDLHVFGGKRARRWAWASAALWLAAFFLLRWGVGTGLLLQAGLFVLLTVLDLLRRPASTGRAEKGRR